MTGSPKQEKRTGKWTPEELEYADAIIMEFRDGSLNLPNGTTLRGHLAEELGCYVKRISKKMEGTNYNGRQTFERKDYSEAEGDARRKKLQDLKQRFKKSVEALKMAESVRNMGCHPLKRSHSNLNVPAEREMLNNGLAFVNNQMASGVGSAADGTGSGGADTLQSLAEGNRFLAQLVARRRLESALASQYETPTTASGSLATALASPFNGATSCASIDLRLAALQPTAPTRREQLLHVLQVTNPLLAQALRTASAPPPRFPAVNPQSATPVAQSGAAQDPPAKRMRYSKAA